MRTDDDLGAGEAMNPIVAAGYAGTPMQEMLITVGVISLAIAMVAVCPIVLWGLRGHAPGSAAA